MLIVVLLTLSSLVNAQTTPPNPSNTSTVGMSVTNPKTGLVTKVKSLYKDPASSNYPGQVSYVVTDDGYQFFVVPTTNTSFYSNGVKYEILSNDGANASVKIFGSSDTPSAIAVSAMSEPVVVKPPAPTNVSNVTNAGSVYLSFGQDGETGRDGALFVFPSNGKPGAKAPASNIDHTMNIDSTVNIGIFAASVGGAGGAGGDSYLSFFKARPGGNGGAGGDIILNNNATSIKIKGDDLIGIQVMSSAGKPGDGGSGYAATAGGSGGSSSNGGKVTVTNNGHVETDGKNSHGIHATSLSAGGGTGGSVWGIISKSGSGGGAGNGNIVSVTNNAQANIFTKGEGSHGIFAQSIGGSGGSSGVSGNLILSLQGMSDAGGSGSTVSVFNKGGVYTSGKGSKGIFAQSVGGSGGSGGTSGGIVALGGLGATGGNAGAVTVKNFEGGIISTEGETSDAIFAQSTGGSGGSGSGAGGLVAIGGSGSKAGNANKVEVENLGTISTKGNTSRGIVAQSIGGGGGDGGTTVGAIAIGGSGSGGGLGDTVTVRNAGAIKTEGNYSHAIFAQSVGGGGGNGSTSGGIITIGGSGGVGNNANAVSVTNAGEIRTRGSDATGIFMQSVGGGGGNGGAGYSGGLLAGFSLGGQGSSGGNGGTATVVLNDYIKAGVATRSSIMTGGDRSVGILAQSVGGGGGNGGTAIQTTIGTGVSISAAIGGAGGEGGNGGVVTMTGKGNVTTSGNNSVGINLQSIGGGGGNGGISVSTAVTIGDGVSIGVAIGGSGGDGGTGGTVTADVTSVINTTGAFSTGFIAQSVGGGGGNGGTTVSASAAGGAVGSAAVSVSIGGNGGGGGNAQAVNVTLAGTVKTTGAQSDGVIVQSIGGGGGNGGVTIAAGLALSASASANLTVAIGSKGGVGGVGSSATADIDSNITTLGDGADGLIVQSIGGGGGNSGVTVSAGGGAGGLAAAGINLGIGGDSGNGSRSDIVNANYNGALVTKGDNATGILAQSVGGGGGNSGGTISASLTFSGVGSGSVTASIGGSGGTGGHGGVDGAVDSVTLITAGSVSTEGKNSGAIVAQSIGGGGGNGGYTIAASGTGSGVGSGTVNIGLGGSGGSAGDGRNVRAVLDSVVKTSGDDSTGILVQSVGGGGGNGGFNVAAGVSGAGVGSGGVTVGLGGKGDKGGVGGAVYAFSKREITTGTMIAGVNGGHRSSAFVAQSIGGGGGNGGFNVSGAISGAPVGSASISVGLGGNAAAGNNAGRVTALTSGNIITAGDESLGIIAQSVGGGGGNGGFNVSGGISGSAVGSAAINVGLGGSGGSSGNGAAVNLTVTNDVTTYGKKAGAILVQSLGGGGGNGGFNVNASVSGAGVGSGAINVGLGGKGSTGGKGDIVVADITGDITTNADDSVAVLAQSVGGGGGNGGFSVNVSASGGGLGSAGIGVSLGGSGGAGGDSSNVNLKVTGAVKTKGNNSVAVIAQSIGGGGGNGGFNVTGTVSGAGKLSAAVGVGLGGDGLIGGNAAAVVAETAGDISTFGNNSGGVLIQSVGGGGGNGGFNVAATLSGAGVGSGVASIGLGGGGAAGGNGSTVDYTGNSNVYTRGHKSSAVVVQSIGSGGGNGGFDVTISGSGAGTGSAGIGVGLGGSSQSGGNGADVTSTIVGNIATGIGSIANDSSGVIVQSVGGGGGNGGFNVTAAISAAGTGSGSAGIGIGGTAGRGGSAGKVVSSVTGNINTNGLNSTGLLAQSLGGGGGNGGITVTAGISLAKTGSAAASIGIGGSGGSGGSADTVNNKLVGNVVTTSDRSGGVLAQSLGGGGGNGGLSITGTVSVASTGSGAVSIGLGGSGGSGGRANKVTNHVVGDIYTKGADSMGVVAQSIGGGGGNGGINVNGSIVASKGTAGALGIGVGGFGGTGGVADRVNNTVSGYVQTLGKDSVASMAQSVAGGGGNGGVNVTGAITATKGNAGSLGIGVGGFGGGGGAAENVINNFTGGAYTEGVNSSAIVAQSIGGGGGNGGVNVTGALTLSKEGSGTLGLGIGGFGGGAGEAGDVTSVINTTVAHPQVTTKGENSPAVVAQSLGGGGGNGGLNITGAVNLSSGKSGAIGVGIGGFGGSGGNSGAVSLSMKGNIVTLGSNSHGIVAQSLAGGGGNGGLNITGAVSLAAKERSGSASIGIGGFGGSGGHAKDVTVNYEGTINSPWVDGAPNTTAKTSYGIVAQSLGGGGGNGNINISAGLSYSSSSASSGKALAVGIGGFGGDGGNAGDVKVTVTGGNSITAHGNLASAIFAQSLGGGGGNGGINISGGVTSSSPVVFGLGGFGGGAGTAGDVTVVSNSDLYANGTELQNTDSNWALDFAKGIGKGLALIDGDKNPDLTGRSTGITAQSIGGGGGNGGLNVSGRGSFNSKDSASSLVFGVGGFGGAGAISGDVSVNSTGRIQTVGDWSHGIMAQSLAGGGGNGAVNITASLDWQSNPDKSSQDVSLIGGIGGFGGSGANAGKVEVTSKGDIITKGAHSRGILAQSIGGGGGTGGLNITTNVTKGSSPLTLGIGGFGSGGGHAGAVTVTRGTRATSAGAIITDGTGAHGLEATSIGGGGGDAGANFNITYSSAGRGTNDKKDDPAKETPENTGISALVLKDYNKILGEVGDRNPSGGSSPTGKKAYAGQLLIGGSGGVAGNGGVVNVHHFGDVETKKKMSHGVFAQSIGGGGGNASLNIGYSKSDNVDKSFDLAVGGATGDGGTGATVSIEHSGKIITRGDDSVAVFAQSVGGGGGNVGLDFSSTSNATGNLNITIGRKGGTGGQAGAVTLTSEGAIQTFGKNSHGLLAQSVGNGGGNSSVTTVKGSTPTTSTEAGRDFNVSVGLEGGIAGFAGTVDVTASGTISTAGESAHAIFAQSVGGGGGNGGAASLGSKLPLAVKTKSYGLAIGGKGGTGGYGSAVTVGNTAVLSTTGKGAIGILAQSVGGGGGTGGNSVNTGRLINNGNVFVNVGGSGGTGSVGGNVNVTNAGIIVTKGVSAHGVLAQTIGGGGGEAGLTISALYNSSEGSSTNLSLLVGGSGGDSNATSGTVSINNTGGVETFAADSIGLFAQSVGGGGGNAGLVTSSTLATGTGTSKNNNFNLSVGGTGGRGGAGGAVTINNTKNTSLHSGLVVTHGDRSHAIVAMSIGGGGGQGSAVSTISRSKLKGTTRSLSVGGTGGTGGTGADVTVRNSGDLFTYGKKAHGILAQSIGGGGGNAGHVLTINSRPEGETAQAISVGGKGGSGNTGGNIIVENTGKITTSGDESYGILAQSIGGGGGNGSIAIANPKNAITSLATARAFNSLSMGGFKGTGGDSGDVTVTHTGSITVKGDNSYGVYAQSVSGGGGTIGASIGNPISSVIATTLQLAVGAIEGESRAGRVKLSFGGNISITGKNSKATLLQSVTGGGGDANIFMDLTEKAAALAEDSVDVPDKLGVLEQVIKAATDLANNLGAEKVKDAIGAAVDYVQKGNIFSSGESSSGAIVQSVGAGGGKSHIDISVYKGQKATSKLALGGKENVDSSGGDIKEERSGSLTVLAKAGAGSISQSIGGGGGTATLNYKLNDIPTAQTPPISQAAPLFDVTALSTEAAPAPVLVKTTTLLGAFKGSGNDGGIIDSTLTGDIKTEGDRTFGIVRQSIGAGGGVQYLSGVDEVTTSIGGKSGAQGNGKSVTLRNTGNLETKGVQAHGIVLQSIGGGGGIQLSDTDKVNVKVTSNTDNSGNGGAINLTQIGNVSTLGDKSVAILAQSLGGGGGVVDRVFADSAGGAGNSSEIMLNVDGDVKSSGDESISIFAQSRAKGTQGDIDITLAKDHTISTGTKGVGVKISGGKNNKFTSYGTIKGKDLLTGNMLIGEEGNETVDSHGHFYGQFDLGEGVNKFTNHAGGVLVPGAALAVGQSSSELVNDGEMKLGDVANAQETNLTGNFVQSSTGLSRVELDFQGDDKNKKGGKVDSLSVTGTAKLAGKVDVSVLNQQLIKSGSYQKTLFRAEKGLEDKGLTLEAPQSLVVNYKLVYPTAKEAALEYKVDFSPNSASLSPNLVEVGNYFNRIRLATNAPVLADVVAKLISDRTAAEYRNTLSQVGPDFYGELQADMIHRSERFGHLLVDGGDYKISDDDHYIWFNYETETAKHKSYGDYKEVNHNSDKYALGLQHQFKNNWVAGIGFSQENHKSSGYQGRWSSKGDTSQLGVILKHYQGDTEYAATLSYAWGKSNAQRTGAITQSFKTDVERNLESFSGMLRVAHTFKNDNGYIRPLVGLGFTNLSGDDAIETGAGELNLILHDHNETHVWSRLGMELGYLFSLDSGLRIKVHGDLGFQYYLSGANTSTSASLQGAPAGTAPMNINIDLNEAHAFGTIGVDLMTVQDYSLGIEYSTILDRYSSLDRWDLRVRIPF